MEENFLITEINHVILVGKEEYTEPKSCFSGDLHYNELIFHFSGQSTVLFDDAILTIKPNTIRFLPKGKAKKYEVIRREHGECIDIFFQTDRPIAPDAFVIDVSQKEKIGMIFKKIFATWVAKRKGFYFESLSLLYKIFALLQNDSYVPQQHFLKIKPAVDEIHFNFLHELTIDRLAAMCSMKESYFQRLFKEKFGLSPKHYIIQLRINHACDLLGFERYSVTQIAELCNFSDVYFFSRQFKEYMGITPTQFRKKYKSSK